MNIPRLVNPVKVDDVVTQWTEEFVHDGSCQCFGNCDCIDDKGKVMSSELVFTHSIPKKHGGFSQFKQAAWARSAYDAIMKQRAKNDSLCKCGAKNVIGDCTDLEVKGFKGVLCKCCPTCRKECLNCSYYLELHKSRT